MTTQIILNVSFIKKYLIKLTHTKNLVKRTYYEKLLRNKNKNIFKIWYVNKEIVDHKNFSTMFKEIKHKNFSTTFKETKHLYQEQNQISFCSW